MNKNKNSQSVSGILMAVGAYFIWGILPVYWKLLQTVPPLEILAHRIIWCLLFLLSILFLSKNIAAAKAELSRIIEHPTKATGVILAALFLTVNWYSYIWAVNNDLVIQASLGYYINPLISVLMGVVVLKEKLSKWQIIACVLAFCGVTILTVNYGTVPWIALVIAFSFALYGLTKKIINIEPITSLILESSIMSIFALIYLFHLHNHHLGSFGNAEISITLLLLGAGIVTSVPLILFSRAVNRLSLSLMGFLQYINPTFSLLLGIFIFHETFSFTHLTAFSIIWTGLLLFSISSYKNSSPV